MQGKILNERYRLERELGRGGLGVVFLTHDLLLERDVAVKVLSEEKLSPASRTRLLVEARSAARLNHPNIVAVFDAGEADSVPYIVMEYVQGKSLRENPPASLQDAILVARQVCLALEEAHAHGIIHRDLKPENILVAPSGVIKLMDFGLARSIHVPEQDEPLVGTLLYISPEQALGKQLDARTDLYSLGVLLYELTTHQLPFQAEDPLQLISQHLNQPPTAPRHLVPDLPPLCEAIILRLLQKNPEDRYASARELFQALGELLDFLEGGRAESKKHNLPAQLTSFIGRQKEMAEITQLLDQTRLLSLTGVGGTGKTRLAWRVAGDLMDQFPDGVWVVELAAVNEEAKIIPKVAAVFGIHTKADTSLEAALLDFLSLKKLLIIFDNCEHLIKASASLIESLLHKCPHLKIMVTSRESLGIQGERNYHVPSMNLPDLHNLPSGDEIWQIEAMQLFHDRAGSIQPGYHPDQEETSFIAQICSRLDGIPLAIELAAARIKTLSVNEIASRLNDRFRLLTGGSRSALPRQQTLQAAIDWSYNLLTEKEQVLLRRFSVFSNGAALNAVEEVCSDDMLNKSEILELLTHLVDKSMVLADTRGQAARYSMLETIRQYAAEKCLSAAETEIVRDRHLSHFTHWVQTVEPELWKENQIHWLDCLNADHDNFRVAIEWSLGEHEDDQQVLLGLQMADSLGFFWLVRGHWNEGRSYLDSLLQHPLAQQVSLERARGLNMAGFLTMSYGDLHKARTLFEEAARLAEQLDSDAGQAYARYGLGSIHYSTHEYEPALALLESAYRQFVKINELPGIALATGQLGALLNSKGDHERSRQYYEINLKTCRKLGHQLGIAGTLLALAYLESAECNLPQTNQNLREALQIYQRAGDVSGLAGVYHALGINEMHSENFDEARKYYEQALQINRELLNIPGMGVTLIALGENARLQGDYDAAQKYYKEALELNESLGQMGIVTIVSHNLGYVAQHRGDYSRALEYFRVSLRHARDHKILRLIIFCLAGIAGAFAEMKDVERAVRLFACADHLAKTHYIVFDAVDQHEVDHNLAWLRQNTEEHKFTRWWKKGQHLSLDQALELTMQSGDVS
jgi:non-specific serine/threonine protein kinase